MNETSTLILRDSTGAFYLLTPELLAQARATAQEQTDLTHAIEVQDTAGYAAGTGLEFSIAGLLPAIVSPRDAASGLPTGKRMHKPFVITKELDRSSPLL